MFSAMQTLYLIDFVPGALNVENYSVCITAIKKTVNTDGPVFCATSYSCPRSRV